MFRTAVLTMLLALAPACCKTAGDCRRSPECAKAGRCTPDWGFCVATSDTDCRASELCRDHGRCTLRDGECLN
jgi:hypothetical protein